MATGTGNLSGVTKVWDTASWEVAASVRARGLHGGGLAFTPDGLQLASSSWDRKPARGRAAGIQLWKAADGGEVPLAPGTDFAGGVLGPDGLTLAIGGEELRVVDIPTGRVRFSLPECGCGALRFSPDGRLLAAARKGRDVVVCDATGGREVRTLPGAGAAIQTAGSTMAGAEYQGMAWSRDGRQLAIRVAREKIRIWDPTTGEEGSTIEQVGPSFAFGADGKRLASAGGRAVRLWDTSTGREVLTRSVH